MSCIFILLVLHILSTHAVKIINFPARQIKDYRGYDDVTILHVKIPEQIRSATWNLTAWEVKMSAISISSCKPRPMTAYVKEGGYPVISPDGSKFPDNYFDRNENLKKLEFSSDKTSNQITLDYPKPGDWFSVVYIDYTDPDDDGIVQSGLTLVCAVIMEASVDVTYVDEMIAVSENQSVKHTLRQSAPTVKFKLYVPRDISSVRIDLDKFNKTSLSIGLEGDMGIAIDTTARASGNASLSEHCSSESNCTFHFAPSENTWYYVTVALDSPGVQSVDFRFGAIFEHRPSDDCNTTSLNAIEDVVFPSCWSTIPLTRQTYSGFFSYGFHRTQPANETDTPYVLVSTVKPTAMSFVVNPIQDIGGTLTLEIKIVMDSLKGFTDKYNVKVLACLGRELQMVPEFSNTCLDSTGLVYPNQLQVNSTSEALKTHVRQLHVPYPESGTWFLSLMPFCFLKITGDVIQTPCVGMDAINMSFVLESGSCDLDNCGDFGRCVTDMNGGLLFSSCLCYHGYRGWACTDDSKVSSNTELLLAVLLLTLSNLFFLPAVVMSVRRRYYTEALVYACTMFFSTFYHACDAGDGIFSFCLIRSSVLQFCDFYSAVLAVWVTLIAMANLNPTLSSLAQMAGAIGIALGSEYNRTSLWMFLIPTLIGLFIVACFWGFYMRKSRSCYPSIKYWKCYLPIGLTLIITGLVCYAFLETSRNYKFVHSFWHAVMALSIIIILPVQRSQRIMLASNGDLNMDGAKKHQGRVAKFFTTKYESLKCWGRENREN